MSALDRVIGTPAVHHGDPETLPCGDCWHVLPAHPSDGSVCVECCDGSCQEVDVDEDGNEIPPDPCECCMGWEMPPAPPGTPRTDGSGVDVHGGPASDGLTPMLRLLSALGHVLHAAHNPAGAIAAAAAAEIVNPTSRRPR